MLHSRYSVIWLVLFCLSSLHLAGQSRFEVIEDFEAGEVTLLSWADEDINPSGWSLDSSTTYNASQYSLKLSGNTWKQQMISPVVIDSSSVIQFAGRTQSGAKYQGIGFSDGENSLFYSISGSTVMNIEVWVPVYQGAFSHNTWNLYQLPLGADWLSFFGYQPMLTSIIYVNDLDNLTNSYSVWFDDILNITSDLPQAPQVSIITGEPTQRPGSGREVGLQFYSQVIDPDSDTFTYRWDFGDGESSDQANPYHLYTIADAHSYTASLKVTDDTGRIGLASTQVQVDIGESSLPLTMNFVGDVMLARRYETGGGIIPTQGVNAIFTPTLPMLGAAADVTCANLEVVLSNLGTPHPTKSVIYRGSPSNISGLVYAGIDQVCLANNHTLDYGLVAQQQMQSLLTDAGISFSGAGANAYEAYLPSFVNKKGLNIAFLRSCDRTGQYNNAQPYLQAGFNKPGFAYMTPYYIGQQIAAVEGFADLKIVEMHGGSEYSLTPGANYDKNNPFIDDTEDEDYFHRVDVPHQWDRQIRQTAVDSGADIVIVHHPHIIQGLEIYNGKLIAHSIGNFVFDLDYPECMPSMILYVDARPEGFSNYRVRPVFIDAYIPKPATGQLGIHILDYLAMKSRELDTVFLVDRENLSGEVIPDPESLIPMDHSFSFTKDFTNSLASEQYTDPMKLPRYGSIASISAVNPPITASARMGSETIWFGNMEDEGSSLWSIPEFSTDAVDGMRSALLSTSTGQTVTATISKKMKWYNNTTKFTLHGWIKTRNVNTANIIIRYYNSRTSVSPTATENITTNITGTTNWAWFNKEITIPASAYYYDIRLSLSGINGQVSQAWFDNVGLIEWTDWQDISALTEIPNPNNYYWIQLKSPESAKSITFDMYERSYFRNPPTPVHTAAVIAPKLETWPNPFNPDTNISFEVKKQGETSLKIYNARGQMVRELISGDMQPGIYNAIWDGRDKHNRLQASGVYFVRLTGNSALNVRKIVLMK